MDFVGIVVNTCGKFFVRSKGLKKNCFFSFFSFFSFFFWGGASCSKLVSSDQLKIWVYMYEHMMCDFD